MHSYISFHPKELGQRQWDTEVQNIKINYEGIR